MDRESVRCALSFLLPSAWPHAVQLSVCLCSHLPAEALRTVTKVVVLVHPAEARRIPPPAHARAARRHHVQPPHCSSPPSPPRGHFLPRPKNRLLSGPLRAQLKRWKVTTTVPLIDYCLARRVPPPPPQRTDVHDFGGKPAGAGACLKHDRAGGAIFAVRLRTTSTANRGCLRAPAVVDTEWTPETGLSKFRQLVP